MSAEIFVPKSRVFDLGVIALAPGTTVYHRFKMPFDGYVARTDASWPTDTKNAIGFRLRVREAVLIPTNPEIRYVADEDAVLYWPTIEKAEKNATVEAEISNWSTADTLNLQIRVTITNFDPRLTTRVTH